MSSRTVIIDPESEGQRLDVFLAANLTIYSRSFLKKLIDEQCVWVNGQSARASYKVRAGEKVTVNLPPPEPAEPLAQEIPLQILYEDADIIVIDKPPGLVVHPAPGSPDGTLVNALLHYCKDLSGIGGVIRPGIVHRLDRDTSGALVVTKNDRTHRDLADQFQTHQVRKTYIAYCGQSPGAKPLSDHGRFETLFGRHPVHRKRFSSRVERGKQAISDYRVLEKYSGDGFMAVKVEVKPKTGRTHQIRVHLADADHPILGDKLYGGRSARMFPQSIFPARQALHAHKLAFRHPASAKDMFFEAPIPDDLVELERALAD
ncbi:MAG: RluA family pseudouridine synthase [Deltaproteobacteria bacterium]|nr:RluA family pseudouridine synthase [Deltaproteobacteria bacterium]